MSTGRTVSAELEVINAEPTTDDSNEFISIFHKLKPGQQDTVTIMLMAVNEMTELQSEKVFRNQESLSLFCDNISEVLLWLGGEPGTLDLLHMPEEAWRTIKREIFKRTFK